MFEHADHAAARREHGYCTDDVARLLIVVVREPRQTPAVDDLGRTAMRFLADSQGVTGRTRNRRADGGRWHGRRGVEDCWGRSMWAFGTAARLAPEDWMRSSALAHFNHGAAQRSPHRRAMAFAALGAAEILAIEPRHGRARALLSDADRQHRRSRRPTRVAVAGGTPLVRQRRARRSAHRRRAPARPTRCARRRTPPAALAARTRDDRRPPVADAGRWGRPDDHGPMFDQQPIEVAAMADACVRALDVTGDHEWDVGIDRCVQWFVGLNDAGRRDVGPSRPEVDSTDSPHSGRISTRAPSRRSP